MRAASHGLPFEPIVGLTGSDIRAAAGLKTVKDPYPGAELSPVPATRPDWAILHVQEADALGNARIYGSPYWDLVMSRAAARGILTAERPGPPAEAAPLARHGPPPPPGPPRAPPSLAPPLPHAPGRAAPTRCHPYYGVDEAGVRAYLET